MAARVRALLAASHPQPSLAVTTLAGVLAAAAGRDALGVLLVVLAFGSGQLSVGWCNDWVDARRDVAVGRADKPVAAGLVSVAAVRAAALTALTATVPLSLLLGPLAGGLHLVAVASAWAYDLGLKATTASALPYAVSFGLLPTIAVGSAVPWWATIAAALLGVGAHLANALPDLDDDRRTGVRNLPLLLGRRGTAAGAAALLVAGTVVLTLGPAHRQLPAAVGIPLAVVLAVAGLARGGRTPFLAAMTIAGLDVALLVARGGQLH